MKKILSYVIIAALLVSVFTAFAAPVSAATSDSGDFGNGMHWQFDGETGELSFSGNGEIRDGDSLAWYFSVFSGSVNSITLAPGVTAIGSKALADYCNLTAISIPATVTEIAPYAFCELPSLDEIIVDEDNPVYSSVGNCLIEKASGRIVLGTNSSVIPESAASIAEGAFVGYSGPASLYIPTGLTDVEFDSVRCSGIEEIAVSPDNPVYRSDGNCLIERATGRVILGCGGSVIPDDGSVVAIEDKAFAGCCGIESVVIPDSVTEIGTGAFEGCHSLVYAALPAGLEAIPAGTFYDCIALESVDYPEGLRSIEEDAFFNCISLLAIDIPDSVEEIGERAFLGCESAISVNIPEGVRVIEDSAFGSCMSLTEIILPESLEVIGDSAFIDCGSLEAIIIPDGVTQIGDSAFAFCSSITQIKLPNSLESIGCGAFECCESLEELTLPENILTIEGGAFVDSAIILTEYGNALYLGTEDNPYYALVQSVDPLIESCQINPDTKIICDMAFEGNENLTEISIPDGVISVGDGAFEECSGLEKIKIPPTVQNIGEGIFSGCPSIKKITIPISILLIANEVFAGCNQVEEVSCEATPEELEAVADLLDSGIFEGADIHVAQDEVLPGDLNCDGYVNAKDLAIMKKVIAETETLEGQGFENGDLNGDGRINSMDLRLLKQMLAA